MQQQWEVRWRDYYQEMGLTPSATSDQIIQAYRLKARYLHPDALAGLPADVREVALEEMKLLNEANEVLGTPSLRADYDREYIRRTLGATASTQQAERPASPGSSPPPRGTGGGTYQKSAAQPGLALDVVGFYSKGKLTVSDAGIVYQADWGTLGIGSKAWASGSIRSIVIRRGIPVGFGLSSLWATLICLAFLPLFAYPSLGLLAIVLIGDRFWGPHIVVDSSRGRAWFFVKRWKWDPLESAFAAALPRVDSVLRVKRSRLLPALCTLLSIGAIVAAAAVPAYFILTAD